MNGIEFLKGTLLKNAAAAAIPQKNGDVRNGKASK
jgi:hypothetical protein